MLERFQHNVMLEFCWKIFQHNIMLEIMLEYFQHHLVLEIMLEDFHHGVEVLYIEVCRYGPGKGGLWICVCKTRASAKMRGM